MRGKKRNSHCIASICVKVLAGREYLRFAIEPHNLQPITAGFVRELAMLLSMAQSNPALFQMISDRKTIGRQLEKLNKTQELAEVNQEELRGQQAQEWTDWVTSYR